ncbi:hypothetical protein MCOR27_001652 [Pyricularia oryzae]|uniref:BHLH domain-containing protein n=2 Tax=Pyricularia TaxID=48558 RepID=A0ABQ8NWP6_PYRGI|nr:hypothetical protein MCOR01_011217 [Pyricularia oryzae]KAI6303244.1 hypothetical protein MCOR33_001509 [Pyricularia grisea]KAH9437706.1 hypothetical protein MCOR02_001358 [Pyricularia oryzae]KAI6256580.1 hypothetical protein MCOR19_006952 [Pyricularia oryzae]KAI6285138.1 hypothetical protein MCOR26_001628 [Pyricularia oryzae]
MAMMGSSAWNGQHSAVDDDFQQYLEMNGMDGLAAGLNFDFQDFAADFQGAGNNGGAILQSQQAQERQLQHQQQMDTPMTGTEMPGLMSTNPELSQLPQSAMHSHLAQLPSVAAPVPHTTAPGLVIVPSAGMVPPPTTQPPPTPSEAINDIDAKIQFLQHQRMQQQQRQLEEQQVAFFAQQSRLIPPTPQSLELQAGSRYYVAPDQTPQQGIYDRYQRLADQQDMSFTPLVSPAVTPLETHFSMDSQFTIPGAYFSPLASPALHAQQENPQAIYDSVSSGKNSSPASEMDLPTPTATKVTPSSLSNEVAKKAVPRKSTASKVRGKGSVRQSPISKPLKKKPQTTPNMNAQALSELAESLQHSQDSQHHLLPPPAPQGHSGSPVGLTDSENGSVSPETLSEMPPPPVPKQRSARPSSHAEPQGAVANPMLQTLQGKMSPATPASLMKLTSPSNSMGATPTSHATVSHEAIENFELPESVNFQQQNNQNPQTSTKSPAQSPFLGPSATSSTTPSLQPLPGSGFIKPRTAASTTQSPLLTSQQQGGGSGSVMGTPILAAAARKTPQMGPRNSKKRPSVSSSHVSPALRPRISPSIKPLLPGGSSGAEDVASQLLRSKSNYQNILEGNSVPGVSYPSELSTNLTSKRTSHKIAEQGRRNRINSALQEIATLLPPTVSAKVDDDGDGDGDGGKKGDKQAGGGPNSKASTVEMAIEYIKMLRKEVAEANKRADEAERKLKLQSGQTNDEEPAATPKAVASGDADENEVEMKNAVDGEKPDKAVEAS